MKKYILMAFLSTFAGGLLIYFYYQGENYISKSNQQVLKLLLTAQRVDAALERDLLMSKDFLTLSYDPLVASEADVNTLCSDANGTKLEVIGLVSRDLDSTLAAYCGAIEQKLLLVEVFKSRNSVLRNSLYFLHGVSLSEKSQGDLLSRLVNASLTYLLVSNQEAKSNLKSVIREARSTLKGRKTESELKSVMLNAEKVLETKTEIDQVTAQIINSAETHTQIERLRDVYTQAELDSESKASSFRRVVIAICFVFFLFSIYSIFSLFRSAQALTNANAKLEKRVAARTRALEESQQKVLEQQEALIASSKMSALGEMAGGVAHEINTPLAIIGLRTEQMTQAITEGTIDPAEFLDAVTTIDKTVGRIAKIVSGLRFFAREGRRGEAQPTRLGFLIEETLALCQERFASHGVNLIRPENQTALDLTVNCHSVEISQVLLNLLNNAFDAIEEKEEKWIKIDVSDREDRVELSVTDCGNGIPQNIRDKIMQPFFTTKDVGKGTGLGLSLSKGIIEDHQGRLTIDSTCPNTRFVITLPKAPPQPSSGTRVA